MSTSILHNKIDKDVSSYHNISKWLEFFKTALFFAYDSGQNISLDLLVLLAYREKVGGYQGGRKVKQRQLLEGIRADFVIRLASRINESNYVDDKLIVKNVKGCPYFNLFLSFEKGGSGGYARMRTRRSISIIR